MDEVVSEQKEQWKRELDRVARLRESREVQRQRELAAEKVKDKGLNAHPVLRWTITWCSVFYGFW